MRRLRMGLIGGGPGAFIGPVHRIAATLDSEIELVAGAFSRAPERSRQAGKAYGIAEDRSYPSWMALIEQERTRPDGIDFLTIATPNDTHLPIARAALAAGIAVMSDKPATATLAQARELAEIVREADRPYALSYTYSGYPLVRHARALIASGGLGTVRKVVVEYLQGWLAAPIERAGNKQAEWRTDAGKSGVGGAIGDIGVHAFHLAEFVTGLAVEAINADLAAVVPGRALDDDCSVLLRFAGGARGVLLASQIAIGEANGLTLRVYGDKASLAWRQESPNQLLIHHLSGRSEMLTAGGAGMLPAATAAARLPAGHPEGYLEAFANLYRDFARRLRGRPAPDLPGMEDGVRSLQFIEQAVAASRDNRGWVPLDEAKEYA
ncbi:Gfo/Idh/MocA family protein [Sphingomonas sp. TDK1]|uniref:Gfo/Idh/MocA family protein n=1 Tax=Sphingomonas sp. TDK1 TaxID=453247 RepID=UPI0007DA0D0E|nr:Gfo/Idh/MocA family oxidoreductase [Sphingomonas sp. TDK1]OAN62331.1 oxidoreductase [Sphingomonas sp. TDK1]